MDSNKGSDADDSEYDDSCDGSRKSDDWDGNRYYICVSAQSPEPAKRLSLQVLQPLLMHCDGHCYYCYW